MEKINMAKSKPKKTTASQRSSAASTKSTQQTEDQSTPSTASEAGEFEPKFSDDPDATAEGTETTQEPAEGDDNGTEDPETTEGENEPEEGTQEPGETVGEEPVERYTDNLAENKPVDQATANIDWSGVPEEGTPDGLILDADEEARFEGEEINGQVVVKRDVYRKVYPRGAKKPSYIKIYSGGAVVPGQSVQRVG